MKILASLAVVAFLVASVAAGVYSTQNAQASPPQWVMDETELDASIGIRDRAQLIQDAIARVASGDQAKARDVGEIAMAWGQVISRSERLARAAAARRHVDVALVQSGTSWVPAR